MSVATHPRPRPEELPDHPGVYLFHDGDDRVLYVGKANSVRRRLANYFQSARALHPRTAAMVAASARVEWVLVSNEVEALQLEYTLIQRHRPRYNVRYRDDKSYPWLAVTVGEDLPRARVERGAKKAGTRYFGPFTHAYAIRETLDLLLRTFPVRTCSPGVLARHRRLGRACMLHDIRKCSGPCVGHVSPQRHREIVDDLLAFLDGRTLPVTERLEAQMRQAAEGLHFELAARLRDQLDAVRTVIQRQRMVAGAPEDFDIAAMAYDDLEAAVQVFFVRRGRVVGRRGFIVDKVEPLDPPALVATFLQQLYGPEGEDIPREVLVPVEPDGMTGMEAWLSQARGGPVHLRVPQRGEKRALLETVGVGANEAFVRHKLKRAQDFDARARSLRELQEALDLPTAPLRIECFDISNLQADQVVASMVVFEDGLPRPSEYRRFALRGLDGQDDVGAMREVLGRRLAHLQPAATATATEVSPDEFGSPSSGDRCDDRAADPSTPPRSGDDRVDTQPARVGSRTAREGRRFSYPPSLVMVDGGLPQLHAALDALAAADMKELPVIGLAKRMEEVWLPGREEPVLLARGSEGLYLLQRVRDEAHRFAITYHRSRRRSAFTVSALDAIEGVGPERRKRLVAQFGSVRRLTAASIDDLQAVEGIGPRLAQQVWGALHASSTPARGGTR